MTNISTTQFVEVIFGAVVRLIKQFVFSLINVRYYVAIVCKVLAAVLYLCGTSSVLYKSLVSAGKVLQRFSGFVFSFVNQLSSVSLSLARFAI